MGFGPALLRFRQRPWPWLAAATALSLLAAWLLKARCVGFALPRVPKVACYTDVQALYAQRGLDHHLVPYLQAFNEYPPVTGMAQWLAAAASWSEKSFFAWNAVGLAALAFATTWVLLRHAGPSPRLLVWALGPPLALYAFYNWDLIPVLLVAAALLAVERGRWWLAGGLLGLGASAKWYPAVVAAVLVASQCRPGRVRQAVAVAGGAAVAVLATNLPFLLANPQLFLETYRFHLAREPNPDTLWAVAAHGASALGWTGVAGFLTGPLQTLLTLLLVAGLAALGWRMRQGKLSVLHGAFAAVVLFVLLNKVLSPQYALWLLPFLALLEVPWPSTALLFATTFLVDVTVRGLYEGRTGASLELAFDKMVPWVVLRHVALAWMLWWCVRGAHPAPAEAQAGRTAEA
ncbi:MAG TPA: glycosyltransferase 87 family protein [Candidatus Thermoplasmatota archaeon]|nr:glycosyltransferase 87 family protein [Candidatus Thermoplasmatota archaeon]